ncbi:MAG: hypothetical protein R2818_10145 [Flavobacteriales bacterium]
MPGDEGVQYGGVADMISMKRITPFRAAVILFLGYWVVYGLIEAFTPTMTQRGGGGGDAWGGVAFVFFAFATALLLGADYVLRKLIDNYRIVFIVELVVLGLVHLYVQSKGGWF